jgi:hypothetical protein
MYVKMLKNIYIEQETDTVRVCVSVCVCVCVRVCGCEREREHLIKQNEKHHNLSTCASLHKPIVQLYIYNQHNTCMIDMEIMC